MSTFINRHYKTIFILFLVLAFIGILLFGGKDAKDANASTVKEKYFTCIDISDGDTLWSIAEEYATVEFETYNAFIDEVKHINNLRGDRIDAGATLVIPVYR